MRPPIGDPNDTNPGPGGFVPIGIPLVYVPNGNTVFNNFAIDPASSQFDPNFGGVINKGLFLYYHNLVPGSAADPFCLGDAACRVHVLQSTPSVVARQLPIAATAAQNIWYELALMWEDRQTEVRNRQRCSIDPRYRCGVATLAAWAPTCR